MMQILAHIGKKVKKKVQEISMLQAFYETIRVDEFAKSLFVNDFEHFGEKVFVMFSVKNTNCLRVLARVLAF